MIEKKKQYKNLFLYYYIYKIYFFKYYNLKSQKSQ